MKRKRKLLSILLSLALVVGMIPAFTMTAEASGTKTITGWNADYTSRIEKVTIQSETLPQSGASISVTPGEWITFFVTLKSGFSLTGLELYVSGGQYIDLGEMNYQGNGTWSKTISMPDWDGSSQCQFIFSTSEETVKLDEPVGYWDGDTIKWRAISGAEKYEMSMDQFLEGSSNLLFAAEIYVNADGTVQDKSYAVIVQGMVNKPIKDLITYNASTKFYSFNYRSLVSIYSNGRYNFRLQAFRDPNIKSELFATEKTVTGTQLKDGYQDSMPPIAVVIASALNVRAEPDNNSARIGGVTGGTEVVIEETQGEWSKITYGSGYGWVQSKYLEITNDNSHRISVTNGEAVPSKAKEGETVKLVYLGPKSILLWEKTEFDYWKVVSGNAVLADVKSSSTTFTMPAEDVVIEGVYKNKEDYSTKPNPFVDVYETDEYYDAVLWAYYATPQITNGIDATHFAPKNTVKRCEAVTFLWRAEGCPEPSSYTNPFKDVKSSDYFYKPVLWAVEKGITNGITDTTFAPNDTLTTAHMITFLYRWKTENPGQGWYEKAAGWAGTGYGGKPFGVNTAVNNTTNCPRGYVVMFLQKAK